MDAGAHYPSHSHAEIEELFMLSGDLHVEGQLMRSGDYCRGDSGSVHGETFTEGSSPRLRLALTREIERHCIADEIFQGCHIELVAFVDVDGAPDAPVEAGVE
jgi:hypothetical protein